MDLMELVVKIKADSAGLNETLDNVKRSVTDWGGAIAGTAGKMGAAAWEGAKMVAKGVADITMQSVNAYKEFEQLEGGVQTLFGTGGLGIQEYAKAVGKSVPEISAEYKQLELAEAEVMKNAKTAFNEAGLSMNEYMEQATTMSASLKQSLEGDALAAAKYADIAIKDMSDNANKMGTDIKAIQNAYQGFSKQNYTMLDNLKLGYGGTKTEMQRLLKDAEALKAKNGELVEYSIDSYADIVDAIHTIQEETGIAGTTTAEAAGTISGSLASVRAAWENVLTTMASGDDAELSQQITNFTESATVAIKNLIPTITTALKGLGKMVQEIAPVIAEELPGLIQELVPPLVDALVVLMDTAIPVLAEMLPDIIQTLLPPLIDGFITLVTALIEHWPEIWAGLKEAMSKIVVEITQAIEEHFPGLGTMILEVLEALKEWSPVLITLVGAWAALKGAMAISETINGVITGFGTLKSTAILLKGKLVALAGWFTGTAIPALGAFVTAAAPVIAVIAGIAAAIGLVWAVVAHWDSIKKFVSDFCDAFVEAWADILEGVGQFISDFGDAFVEAWADILGGVAQFFSDLGDAFVEAWADILGGVADWLAGIGQAFTDFKDTVAEKWEEIKTAISEKWDALKEAASEKWEALKTAISDVVDALGTWLSDTWENIKTAASEKWDAIKTAASEKWEGIKTTISDLVEGIKTAVAEKWEEIKTKASQKWDEIKTAISDKWQAFWDAAADIGTALWEGLKSVISDAWTWGKDLVVNFCQGIWDNLFNVDGAAEAIANKVAAYTEHSRPTKGPLVHDDTFMPDMIDLFVGGIRDNLDKVEDASTDLAYAMKPDLDDVAEGYDVNVEGTGVGAGVGGLGTIIIPMYLDGSIIDERVITAEQIYNYRSGGR